MEVNESPATELLQAAHAMPPDPARTAALDVSAVAADLPEL
jgi:hypothetical protein